MFVHRQATSTMVTDGIVPELRSLADVRQSSHDVRVLVRGQFVRKRKLSCVFLFAISTSLVLSLPTPFSQSPPPHTQQGPDLRRHKAR